MRVTVVLQEGIPSVVLKRSSPSVTVAILKSVVFFEDDCTNLKSVSDLKRFGLYKDDHTRIPEDKKKLSKHGVTGNDQLYLREEGMQRLFVQWKQQRIEFWVRANVSVGEIIDKVFENGASTLGLDTGSCDMYELRDVHSSPGAEDSSTSLSTMKSSDQGRVLPREQTLEELGIGESPELQLTLKTNRPPNKNVLDNSSLPDIIGVTTEAVTCTGFHVVWKKPEAELNIELNWYKPPAVEASSGPITAYILEYGERHSSAPPCSISLSGVVEEHTVTGLKPHTGYYVKVAAVNAAGRGAFCEPVLVQTAPDKPVAAPENVQVEASEDKPSIFVTWSPIQKQYYNSDSLTGYHVRYTTSSKDCKGGEIEVQPDETSCSLDFLDRGVAYAVSVAAANDVGMGPYSIHSSVTMVVGVPPDAPAHQVKVVPDNVMSTSFLLTWCPPPVETASGPITAYILEYGERRSSAPPCSISLSGVVEEHTVTGLKPHTEYFVKVAAVNAAGRGPFSEPVLVQTAPDKPVAAPENVQVEASEDKPSIFVTWSPIQKQYYNSDSLTGYHVRYTTSSKDCKGGEIEVRPDETSCSLDFLDRGVAYAVSVAAANDVGMGPYSIPLVAMVLGVPPDAPAHQVKVVPDNVMSTSFRLTWCPPPVETSNGPITAYILEYSESSGETPPCSISLSGVDEEHTVTGLKPHTEYYVKVAAVNAAGRGPFCEQVLVQTAPDKPVAAPENVQVEASEDKPSIFVTWSPIQKQYYNSDSLTGYHVRYTTSSKDCKGGEIEVQPDETSRSLDFLDRGVAYAVSVAAANDVGMGPYSIPSVAMVLGAPDSDDAVDPKIDLILHVEKILKNLTVAPPSGKDLSAKCRLIYIAVMDITVLPYLVNDEQCVRDTISELCSLLGLQTPTEWYLSKSPRLQLRTSERSESQPAVGLFRKKSKKGKKPGFSVGSALSKALDDDHVLDETKTWAEAELQSESCIVHMRPRENVMLKITEETDFGGDAELGQQMLQQWYRITQGHQLMEKDTAIKIAALMCMCHADQVDGTPDAGTNVNYEVSSYLPKKLQQKSSMRKAAVKKYNAEKTVGRDEATAQLQKSLATLPAFNGVFFDVKVPCKRRFGPKMKTGVLGVGPKGIAYGFYDGSAVQGMTTISHTAIKCFHASESTFVLDHNFEHGTKKYRASTRRAFDIMHLLKIYIQQLPFLDECPTFPLGNPCASLRSYLSYPILTEADILSQYSSCKHVLCSKMQAGCI